MDGSTDQPRTNRLGQGLQYGTPVLVGGIRGRILGDGYVEGVVQKQHPSGRVTVRIHGRNHVVSGQEVFPRSTVRIPPGLFASDHEPPTSGGSSAVAPEQWWVDTDGVTVRDENRLIVATAAGPDDAALIARAPTMDSAIRRALERLEHETGAPIGPVVEQLGAALARAEADAPATRSPTEA